MRTRAVAAAGIAALLAVGGAALTRGGTAGTTPQPLRLKGMWQGIQDGARIRVWVGASAGSPTDGIALVQGPLGFSVLRTAGADGALRIVATPRGRQQALALSSARGSAYDLELGPFGVSLTPLGRKLDATHLPGMPASGVAIDTRYGPGATRAVVLARLVPGRTAAPIGYLDGWRLAGVNSPAYEQLPLDAPPILVSPEGKLFRIGAGGLAVAPGAKHGTASAPAHSPSAQCNAKAGTLRCRGMAPVGIRTGRNHADLWLVAGWPSPDRRTLLVQGVSGCDGSDHSAFFVPAGGGQIMPVAAGPDVAGSTALGWLPSGEALVAIESSADCGSSPSGIYRIFPGDGPVLVVPTLSRALVHWGRGV